MKCYKIFYVFLLFTLLSCEKKIENFSPTTKLDGILKNDDLSKVYYDFRIENPYLSYLLKDRASFKKFVNEVETNDLVLLTECEKPMIRCFAFKALIEQNYPKIREMLFRHKYDNEKVEYLAGRCIRMDISVKNYMLQQLSPFSGNKYSFNRSEYREIQKEFREE
ncbi:hypothetical protein [Flavobacterium sp. KACC 22763]|uniref:hypothetical protein n=1 Tax=Flavobacterium sp. KACC 22763 TaxID=3025668 RepID=UPI00236555A7|nr:hypothetical protein [Flavobacterium sp. KACC 22763]WDF65785.1 hypothetical protein PQ463_06345 [Flavobacterium sp. KACC 22763]